MASLADSEIPWMEENGFLDSSTSLPKIAAEEELAIGTLVIIVISVIFTISALFAIGIFLDCRHQKLISLGASDKEPNRRLRFPRFMRKSTKTDRDVLTDNAEGPSTSTTITIPSSSQHTIEVY